MWVVKLWNITSQKLKSIGLSVFYDTAEILKNNVQTKCTLQAADIFIYIVELNWMELNWARVRWFIRISSFMKIDKTYFDSWCHSWLINVGFQTLEPIVCVVQSIITWLSILVLTLFDIYITVISTPLKESICYFVFC